MHLSLAYLSQDLFWFLQSDHLIRPRYLQYVSLNILCHQLCLDHLLFCLLVCLLDERVVHKLLLQQEVLELLLLHALHLLRSPGIQEPKFVHLDLPLMVCLHCIKDPLPGGNSTLVTPLLLLEELLVLLDLAIKVNTLGCKPLKVIQLMVLYSLSQFLGK